MQCPFTFALLLHAQAKAPLLTKSAGRLCLLRRELGGHCVCERHVPGHGTGSMSSLSLYSLCSRSALASCRTHEQLFGGQL